MGFVLSVSRFFSSPFSCFELRSPRKPSQEISARPQSYGGVKYNDSPPPRGICFFSRCFVLLLLLLRDCARIDMFFIILLVRGAHQRREFCGRNRLVVKRAASTQAIYYWESVSISTRTFSTRTCARAASASVCLFVLSPISV